VIAREVATRNEVAICTLKDAVKLDALWPRAAESLWYVSQRVAIERGEEGFAALFESVLRARDRHSGTAGASRPQSQTNGH
jgi:tetraacyldisaccharide-1-P 4'-kinase